MPIKVPHNATAADLLAILTETAESYGVELLTVKPPMIEMASPPSSRGIRYVWGVDSFPDSDAIIDATVDIQRQDDTGGWASIASEYADPEERVRRYHPEYRDLTELAARCMLRLLDEGTSKGIFPRPIVTVATLDRLSTHLVLRPLIEGAGLSYDTIMARLSRYRRGESYPELSVTESLAIIEGLRRVRGDIDHAIK